MRFRFLVRIRQILAATLTKRIGETFGDLSRQPAGGPLAPSADEDILRVRPFGIPNLDRFWRVLAIS